MSSFLVDDLFAAVCRTNVEEIKKLLRKGAHVNAVIQSGQTVLGHAVLQGDAGTVEVLLNAELYLPPGGDASSSTREVSSAIESYLQPQWFQWNSSSHEEDSSGRVGLCLFRHLQALNPQRRKCDVNMADYYDRMPIHYAAELGDPAILDLLLKAGCRVNVSDSQNITPLHFATGKGHVEVTEMLLKAGSRVNSKTSDKSSALHIAAGRGFSRIVELLLQHGAKIDILDSSDRTPLFLAINHYHHHVVAVLLARGAKVNLEEIHGYSPLSEAVFQKDCAMVRMLLTAGSKVTGGHCLLHYSILHRSLELTLLLLEAGFVVNRKDESGDNPLHVAVRTAQLDVLHQLVRYGGNVNAKNSFSGQSLMHEAVEGIEEAQFQTFRSIVQLLLHSGCRLNVESFTEGDTPLYRAILLDKFLFCEELIRQGSDVNLGNVYSCDIDNLCLARRKNHFGTVRLVVYAGFRLRRSISWLEVVDDRPSAIDAWLARRKSNPLDLASACRIAVRRFLGENLVPKICSLDVPQAVKSYLLLEDVTSWRDSNANLSR